MQFLSTRSPRFMTHCDGLLLAVGVSGSWTRGELKGVYILDVPASDVDRVATALGEVMAEDRDRQLNVSAPLPTAPLILQPAFALGIVMAALTLAFFWSTGGSEEASLFHRVGLLRSDLFWRGDWWRVVTAGCLHGDLQHAVSNAGFLLVLGWAAGERVGLGMASAAWLLTAMAGFGISLWLSPAVQTVGASGGLFGLLGLAGGHAVRNGRSSSFLPRTNHLRNLGGAVMLLALTAFSPKSNIKAHVGGFVAGFVLGLLMRKRPLPAWAQLAAGICTTGLVVWAWRSALGSAV